MIIKCDDYLPSIEGNYNTDLGELELLIHGPNRRWYQKIVRQMTSFKCTSYVLRQPIWWDKSTEE